MVTIMALLLHLAGGVVAELRIELKRLDHPPRKLEIDVLRGRTLRPVAPRPVAELSGTTVAMLHDVPPFSVLRVIVFGCGLLICRVDAPGDAAHEAE